MTTPESQKRAARAYYHRTGKNTHKTISISLTPQEADEDRRVISEHGTTPKKLWRDAIERLKSEPTNGDEQ